jgi:hypothetical protein
MKNGTVAIRATTNTDHRFAAAPGRCAPPGRSGEWCLSPFFRRAPFVRQPELGASLKMIRRDLETFRNAGSG